MMTKRMFGTVRSATEEKKRIARFNQLFLEYKDYSRAIRKLKEEESESKIFF